MDFGIFFQRILPVLFEFRFFSGSKIGDVLSASTFV
ncbi:hypothetical protein LSS_02929 [Leptospira santarosai serovar Shermani str. LT 821]|uniref:Uncharacterized protein n=1 Tax=Leptospira santarosai serovar Shermani str. LT 821 TaxID=758847 RepID=K8Y5R1_9LEPT|nr:hypothetical protein LSS_02929 [Leptospira santarosai serovar Shermani str. LT 821]